MERSVIRESAHAGTAAPANAPEEVSQPLQPNAGGVVYRDRQGNITGSMTPLERARQNERELAPLNFPQQGGVREAVVAAAAGKLDPFYQQQKERAVAAGADAPKPKGRIIRRASGVVRPPVPVDGVESPVVPGSEHDPTLPNERSVAELPLVPVPVEALDPLDLNHPRPPAYSDTDSPSRGVPRMDPSRPGKEITGGFADQADLSYFGLDGGELRVLVQDMLLDLSNRLNNDLRFNEALVYPRVSVRCRIEVTGYAKDEQDLIDKVLNDPRASKLPLEVAKELADEMCFVVVNECRETDDNGEPLQAPNAIRESLGLTKPFKRIVQSGAGQILIDR